MSVREAFPPGTRVHYGLGGSTPLTAEVESVCFGRDGRVEYLLAWVKDGDLKKEWFHADHVSSYSPRASFGFVLASGASHGE